MMLAQKSPVILKFFVHYFITQLQLWNVTAGNYFIRVTNVHSNTAFVTISLLLLAILTTSSNLDGTITVTAYPLEKQNMTTNQKYLTTFGK